MVCFQQCIKVSSTEVYITQMKKTKLTFLLDSLSFILPGCVSDIIL